MVEKHVSKEDGKIRQFLAAIVVNLAALSYGLCCGWASPMIPLFRSSRSPFAGEPITEQGATWIGALLCLGGLAAAPFSGSLADRFGRKRFGYMATVPMLVAWLMEIFAPSHTWIFVARFVSGISASMTMFLVPCYVSEIANEDIRGALGSLLVFAINVGILLVFIAGPYLPYRIFGMFNMSFTLLFLGAFIFMPETPVFLVRAGRLREATRSLMFFKSNNKSLVDKELIRLQSQIKNAENSLEKPSLRVLIQDKATLKGMIISTGLLGGQQLSGIFAMISYAETIFKMAGSSLSAEAATIIIGAIQVFGSYLSTVLMERAGRRPLILISCGGMCLCHLVVGSFCYLQNAKYDVSVVSWIPIVALSLYMITYCLGMGPAPFVIVSEVFRVDVTSLANTCCFVFLWFMAFAVMMLFGPLMELIGIEGCFFLLGTFCAGSFIFNYILLPETKGRRREEIVEELAGVIRPSSHYDEKVYVCDKDMHNKDLMCSEQV